MCAAQDAVSPPTSVLVTGNEHAWPTHRRWGPDVPLKPRPHEGLRMRHRTEAVTKHHPVKFSSDRLSGGATGGPL